MTEIKKQNVKKFHFKNYFLSQHEASFFLWNAFLVTFSFCHSHFTQSPNIDGPELAGGGLEFDSNDDWKSSAIETEIRFNSAQSGIEKLLNQTTGDFSKPFTLKHKFKKQTFAITQKHELYFKSLIFSLIICPFSSTLSRCCSSHW